MAGEWQPGGGAARDRSVATVLIVAGPTCSGKSALAMELAHRWDGVVINADSMQTYRELRVLTARPGPEDEAAVPHRLYGVRPAAKPGSAAWWRGAALAEIDAAHAAGRLPILCGGTGLYLDALLHGLADIPEPGEAARLEARRRLTADGAPALHALLRAVDPDSAARLRPSDGQRLARAWEVWRGTGHGIAWWQDRGREAVLPLRRLAIRLDPPREALRAAIAVRFGAMLAAGALEEVRALLRQDLDPGLPAMRAHGVPELAAHLRGELALDEAGQRACDGTARYTKRQTTWFRHHALAEPAHTHMIHARYTGVEQLSESLNRSISTFLRESG